MLFAEDDDDIRELVREALADLGIRLVTARSGDEALSLLDRNPGVALLITDVRMPGELDGIALAHAARRRYPGIRVLYTTAYDARLVDNALGPLDGRLLRKPYRLTSLREEVKRALEAK